MTAPLDPPGVEPPYSPGVEPKSKGQRFIIPRRYARRNVIIGLAVIFGAVVILGFALWYSGSFVFRPPHRIQPRRQPKTRQSLSQPQAPSKYRLPNRNPSNNSIRPP